MINQESKRSYFEIEIGLDPSVRDQPKYFKKSLFRLENQMDLFFDKMHACDDTVRVIDKEDISQVSFLFRVNSRKRLGSVRNSVSKLIESEMSNVQSIDCSDFRKGQYESKIAFYKKQNSLLIKENINNELSYKGSDIKVFENRKNLFSWQKKLEDMLFEKNSNQLKKAKDREIILFRCPKGNSGKSTFLKYLYFKNSKDITFIGEGSISQISSGVVNNGSKKCYLIDLPRTRSDDQRGLLATIENIKSGLLQKSMYGSGDLLIMEVPWIIICSNYIPLGSFSADRWSVYDLVPNKNRTDYVAKDVTVKMRKMAEDKILIDEYEVLQEERQIKERAVEIRSLIKKDLRKLGV